MKRTSKPMIEFKGVKIFEKDLRNYSSLIRAIKNRGWRALGTGAFSAVFGHPRCDFVIKVTINDPKGVRWLKACAENHNENPFLPKVYEVWDVKFSHPKPTPAKFKVLGVKDEDVFDQRREATVTFLELLEPARDPDLAWIMERNLTNIRAVKRVFGDSPQIKYFEAAAIMLQRIVGRNTFLIDLHGENVMMRGAQPVINDPIAS
jgi:hypothetical protein